MIYRCENCGEEITKEEYINQGFNSYCVICSKLNKKEKQKRAIEIIEKRNKEIKESNNE